MEAPGIPPRFAGSDREGRGPLVLITGLSGFTGRHLSAELCAAGYRVTGLQYDGQRVGLEDRDGLHRALTALAPDAVIHLAAIAHVAHGDVEQIYRTNLIGSRNLLEALAGAPQMPRAVVLASSANIYGNAEAEQLTEDTPPHPANDYAVSKLAMEYMARLWLDRLPVLFARPFNYTGAGQSESFLVPKIVRHFAGRAPAIELGNRDVWRDFSDVRDVARSYRVLLEHGHPGEAYNICSGTATSLDEILQMVSEISGHRLEIRTNPAFVRSSEVRRLTGSRTRLDALAPSGPRIPLRETLEWMIRMARTSQSG